MIKLRKLSIPVISLLCAISLQAFSAENATSISNQASSEISSEAGQLYPDFQNSFLAELFPADSIYADSQISDELQSSEMLG